MKRPPPLPPGGPLMLREEGPIIVLLTLATEDRILLLQLRHMKVIGPNLRFIKCNEVSDSEISLAEQYWKIHLYSNVEDT